MQFFIDTEFNGWGGQLISLALVPIDITHDDFYEEFLISEDIEPWVKDNVMPYLTKQPRTRHEVQNLLATYLSKFKSVEIIADWPDDIKYFCDLMVTGPGEVMCFGHNKFSTQVLFNLSITESETLHNALSDARALRDDYLTRRVN